MHVSPAFDRRLAELSPDSDRVWLAGLSTGLALTIVAAFAPCPPMAERCARTWVS